MRYLQRIKTGRKRPTGYLFRSHKDRAERRERGAATYDCHDQRQKKTAQQKTTAAVTAAAAVVCTVNHVPYVRTFWPEDGNGLAGTDFVRSRAVTKKKKQRKKKRARACVRCVVRACACVDRSSRTCGLMCRYVTSGSPIVTKDVYPPLTQSAEATTKYDVRDRPAPPPVRARAVRPWHPTSLQMVYTECTP